MLSLAHLRPGGDMMYKLLNEPRKSSVPSQLRINVTIMMDVSWSTGNSDRF